MWDWRYISTFLDLGIRWRLVVSFTHRPLYHRGKSTRYPLEKILGGPQCRSGVCEEEKHLLPLAGIKLLPSNTWPVSISTELFRPILI
jgi:hypothetical protein